MQELLVQHLSVRYRGHTALEDISFSLHTHDVLMLAGPNGAGKSTLLGALDGALPVSGCVTLDGADVRTMHHRTRARRIAYLLQDAPAPDGLRVFDAVLLGRMACRSPFAAPDDEDRDAVSRALREAGAAPFADRFLSELSGGERARAYLAQCFAQESELLLLDEPTGHLDASASRGLFDALTAWVREEGRALVCAVHDVRLARAFGTHALLLSRGRAAAFGRAKDALDAAHLASVYGSDILAWEEELTRRAR